VRIGGIGGVTTHPDYRRRGLASQLMTQTADVMRSGGYELGLLFTEIPARFYRNLGWHSMPMAGFRARWEGRSVAVVSPLSGTPSVELFIESRDLEEVVALYQRYNEGRSGTMLRPRPHWDYSPSRVRGVLPTIVVRSDHVLGYLNWNVRAGGIRIGEIASEAAAVTDALLQHLLMECDNSEVTQVYGEIPHTHPFVDSLVSATEADLELKGNASMMALPLDLPRLVEKTVGAIDSVHKIPTDLLLRLLFGESSTQDLLPVLTSRGIDFEDHQARRLEEIFPRRDPVFWAPDHF